MNAKRAEELRQQACRLSDRINEFEQAPANSLFRVEVTLPGDDFSLRFARAGNHWELSVIKNGETNQRRLSTTTMTIKIRAVKRFPALIEAMTSTQDELVEQLREANALLDTVLASFPVKPASPMDPVS